MYKFRWLQSNWLWQHMFTKLYESINKVVAQSHFQLHDYNTVDTARPQTANLRM